MGLNHLVCRQRASRPAVGGPILDKQHPALAHLCDQCTASYSGCLPVPSGAILHLTDGAKRTAYADCRTEPSLAGCDHAYCSAAGCVASVLAANPLNPRD